MTKKDYIAIANIFKKFNGTNGILSSTHFDGVNETTLLNEFCNMFALDNVHFDKNRFIEYIESDKRYKDFTDK
jgi:hypothetical protein